MAIAKGAKGNRAPSYEVDKSILNTRLTTLDRDILLKAGMVHSDSGWTRGVQVKLWSIENACHTWAP